MQHKCKVTVIDKKLYPELQQRYCADPQSGPCPCYNVGDEFVFERYGAADDFWHIGAGTLRTPGASGTAGGEGLAPSPPARGPPVQPNTPSPGTPLRATSTPPCRAAASCAVG